MTLEIFIWSVIASVIAAIIAGSTYKIINNNKTKKTINQKGDNNQAFMDSKININSNNTDRKGEKQDV